MNKQTIRIKYFTDKIEKLTYIDGKSDWIDLRAADDLCLKKGDFALVPLGIAMELPQGTKPMLFREVPLLRTLVLFRRIIWVLLMNPTAEITTSGLCLFWLCAIQRFM